MISSQHLCYLVDVDFSPACWNLAQSAEAVEYHYYFSLEVRPPPNECSGYDTKQSDGEAPIIPGM